MNNSQVTHIWAQQTGKDANGSNFFSVDKTIYSYGYDFPIARFIDDETVLFTTRSYSISTAKHINYVRQAISHITRFNVVNVEATTKTSHKENYNAMLDSIQDKAKTISRGRSNIENRINRLNDDVRSLNYYSRMFKLGRRSLPPFFPETIKADFAVIIAKERKAAKAQLTREKKEEKENLDAWLNGCGFSNSRVFSRIFGTDFLRVKDEEQAETNQGAVVPLDHCRKAWPLIKAYCENGREFTPNGKTIKIGYFAINHISKTGIIKAGCHTFKFSELARFAAVLGL